MAIIKNDFQEEEEYSAVRPTRASKKKTDMKSVWMTLSGIIIVAVIIFGVAFGKTMMFGDPIAKVSGSDWQAVFLTNGQVYFGKVKVAGSRSLTLTDIYYLQVVTKPLQTTQQGTAATADSTQQELTLIKLGNEIHGPTDRMVINRDQILLTEKLKNDSRVVQAIIKYVADQVKK